MTIDHDDLVRRARSGDSAALDTLVREINGLVFGLATRMLGHPHDAEDATQEILIRVVTALSTFRGESSFRTWVYRVASNHLLTTRGTRARHPAETFDEMSAVLAAGVASSVPPTENTTLVGEAQLACTSAMLHCLDRDQRLAYILGEILELDTEDAAAIVGVELTTFRKRLSRARSRMAEFLAAQCGLVDAACRCRCAKQAANAVATGKVDVERLTWIHRVKHQAPLGELRALENALVVFRTELEPPEVTHQLRALITTGGLALFS